MAYTIRDTTLRFQDGSRIEVFQTSFLKVGNGYVGIGKEHDDSTIFPVPSHLPLTVFTLYNENREYIGREHVPKEWPRDLKGLVKATKKGELSLWYLLQNPTVGEYLEKNFRIRRV